jgi:hypothetical protein
MLDIFRIKKHLDQLTRKKTRLKKICFPSGGLEIIALAYAEWVKNGLYSLYAVWEDNSSLRHVEILSCQNPFTISKSKIIFHWLAIKFSSPEQTGVGCNIYDIDNLCPGLTQIIKSCQNSRNSQPQNTFALLPE